MSLRDAELIPQERKERPGAATIVEDAGWRKLRDAARKRPHVGVHADAEVRIPLSHVVLEDTVIRIERAVVEGVPDRVRRVRVAEHEPAGSAAVVGHVPDNCEGADLPGLADGATSKARPVDLVRCALGVELAERRALREVVDARDTLRAALLWFEHQPVSSSLRRAGTRSSHQDLENPWFSAADPVLATTMAPGSSGSVPIMGK